jgi:hypothetical protein
VVGAVRSLLERRLAERDAQNGASPRERP